MVGRELVNREILALKHKINKIDIGNREKYNNNASISKVKSEIAISNNVQWHKIKRYIDRVSIPQFSIVMWSGKEEDVPEHWYICNGQTVKLRNGKDIETPDLTLRFILGAGTYKDADDNDVEIAIGGTSDTTINTEGTFDTEEHILKVNELPSHTHSFTRTLIPRQYSWSSKIVNVSDNDDHDTSITEKNLDYDHPNSGSTGNGDGHTHQYVPPYYAIAYIMKIDKDYY